MPTLSSKKKLLVALVVVCVGLPLLVVFYNHAKAAHDKSAMITLVGFIKMDLEKFVTDKGSFPESLQAMLKTEGVDTNLLWLYPGASLNYVQPMTNAPDATEVVVVTYQGSKIVITKDLHWTVSP